MESISTYPLAIQRLEGKVALITGGAKGIGEFAAKHFVKHGAKVMIADIHDELGKSVCNDIGASSVASYIHCDVTNEDDVKNAVDSTVARYGKLDIMYINAGILCSLNPYILDVTQSEFKQVIEVNLIGAFLCIKHASRTMIQNKRGGSIITAGSVSSVMGGFAPHAYASSKHGVVGLTKNTAVELGKYGIRVNCLSPHVVATPMIREMTGLDDEAIAKKVYSNLKGSMCKLEDVVEAALFLASDDSKYISGHNLVVDGGLTIMNGGFCMFE